MWKRVALRGSVSVVQFFIHLHCPIDHFNIYLLKFLAGLERTKQLKKKIITLEKNAKQNRYDFNVVFYFCFYIIDQRIVIVKL